VAWWNGLKEWQKWGILVGGIHLILYLALYLLTSGSMGVLLLYDLELPWLFIIRLVIGDIPLSGTHLELFFIGIIGTLLYSSSSMIILLLIKSGKQGKETYRWK